MSEQKQTPITQSAAAKLFDIRIMIGGLFVVYGVMLTIAGFFTSDFGLGFDVVVGADDVDSGKPHPETYATVAEKLGVAPANCLVFEDAILGEHAAYKAGMHCVAVTTNLAAADFQAPLLAIQDFTGLTPEHLRALFGPVGEAPQADDEVTKGQDLAPVAEATA